MILIDLNQTLISALMAQIGSNASVEINENLVRHIVLSTILHFKKTFGEEYGEVVLCDDDRDYWRRDFFPYYKRNREKKRKDSPFDWHLIFSTLDTIKKELIEHFPYKLLKIDRAEADDIIGTLAVYATTEKENPEKVIIISNDQDFMQLQKYPGVRQYSPMQKRYIKSKDPKKELLEKIIRGDSGDGIPNILSDGDTFMVEKKRQTPLRQKRLDEWTSSLIHFKQFLNEDKKNQENFNRNARAIDLTYIPLEIQKKILTEYEAQDPKKKDFMKYFIDKKLKILMESAQDF